MITLIEAFRLCHIKDELVFLRAEGVRGDHSFWSEKIRKRMDMRAVKVVGIDPRFPHFDYGYDGMCFTVRGITDEELTKEEFYMRQMK